MTPPEQRPRCACCPPWRAPTLAFTFVTPSGPVTKCLRHAIVHRRLLVTALATAAVVGTILTAINQGNVILSGHFPAILYWKVPLTYCVPYSVSTFSQLRISHVKAGGPAFAT